MSSISAPDSTELLHVNWPGDNIIDRLSYIELRAITDGFRKNKYLKTFIDEKVEDISTYGRDNEKKIILANEIIDYLRRQVGGEYQAAVNRLRRLEIIVTRSEGHHFTFRVQEQSTGRLLKELIRKQTGRAVEDQFLSFKSRMIEDEHTLKQHCVSNKQTVHVQFRGSAFDVFVQGLSKTYTLRNLTAATTVRTVRGLISEREGQNPENLMLACNSRPLEDGKTLGYYEIGRDSTIVVTIRVRGG